MSMYASMCLIKDQFKKRRSSQAKAAPASQPSRGTKRKAASENSGVVVAAKKAKPANRRASEGSTVSRARASRLTNAERRRLEEQALMRGGIATITVDTVTVAPPLQVRPQEEQQMVKKQIHYSKDAPDEKKANRKTLPPAKVDLNLSESSDDDDDWAELLEKSVIAKAPPKLPTTNNLTRQHKTNSKEGVEKKADHRPVFYAESELNLSESSDDDDDEMENLTEPPKALPPPAAPRKLSLEEDLQMSDSSDSESDSEESSDSDSDSDSDDE